MPDIHDAIIFALIGWIMLKEVREYLRDANCQERIDLARREGSRAAASDYRQTYNAARADAITDARKERNES